MHTIAVITMVSLTALPVLLHAAEPRLDSFKQTYETEVQKIRDRHVAKEEQLLGSYGKSLDRAIEILKRQGDPDKVLQAITERRRFEEERTIPKTPDTNLPTEIQDIRAGYHDATRKAEIEKGRSFVSLTQKYMAALDSLMKTLTAKEKLVLALNVKTEKQRVEFALADVETQVKAAEMQHRRSQLPPEGKDSIDWHGHFYKFFSSPVSWREAKRRCEAMGGHLATATSEQENEFLGSLPRGVRTTWIGASDEKREGNLTL